MSPPLSSMRILIIGGGMGGLSTALALSRQGFTNITIFEMAPQLTETVGAGINITPNLSRILDRFGVLNIVQEEGVCLEGARILKSKTDEVLSAVNYGYIEEDFHYPFIVAHRSTLQRALIVGCEQSGVVRFRLGTFVTDIDLEETRIRVGTSKLKDHQEWIQGDVILAADGVKSATRARIMERYGVKDEVEDTGQAAYRVLLKREQLLDKPELLELLDGKMTYRWIGHQRLIMSYPISSHQLFNIVSAHPDTNFAEAPSTTWTTRGSKQRMLEIFSDFCPRVKALLELVPEGNVCEWKMRVHQPLPSWYFGRTALVGDACHPTLPHLAQGAAQAVEDGAVLAVVLSKIKSEEDIPKALKIYEQIRKTRADNCVSWAAENGRGLHLADEEASERDKLFREANKEGGRNPDKAADKETQRLLFTHDCEKEALDQWNDLWNEEDV